MSSTQHHLDARGVVVACPQCGQRNRLAYARLTEAFRCGQCQRALGLPAEPLEVPSVESFEGLVRTASLPVLVDFWAPWCGPCRMVAPEVVKVAAALAGRAVVAKVNTEELAALGQQFGIASIPTFAVFRRGVEVARESGALPAAGLMQLLARAAG